MAGGMSNCGEGGEQIDDDLDARGLAREGSSGDPFDGEGERRLLRTGDIEQRIETIQSDTQRVVAAIAAIRRTIEEVNDISAMIATAVEEQSVTTAEIGRSVTHAAQGGSEINANVQRMADTVGSLHAGAASTAQAATELARLAQDQTTLLGHFRC